MTVKEIVDSLSDTTLMQCIQDFEQYEKNGSIGDSTLRKVAEDVCKTLHNDQIVFWMQMVALESYRRFAKYYFEDVVEKLENNMKFKTS